MELSILVSYEVKKRKYDARKLVKFSKQVVNDRIDARKEEEQEEENIIYRK